MTPWDHHVDAAMRAMCTLKGNGRTPTIVANDAVMMANIIMQARRQLEYGRDPESPSLTGRAVVFVPPGAVTDA